MRRPLIKSAFMFSGLTLFLFLACLSHAAQQDDSDDFFSDSSNSSSADSSDDFFGDSAPTASQFQPTGHLSGKIWEKIAGDMQKDNEDEYLVSNLAVIFAEADFVMSEDLSAKMSFLFTHDAEWNKEEQSAKEDLQVWEAFAKYKMGAVDLRVGQSIWAWGLTDIVNPTNLINPIDLNRYFDIEMNLARLPVLSAGATWYFSSLRLEGVYLPFHRPSKFAVAGRDTALLGHRFPLYDLIRYVEDEKSYRYTKRFLDHWIPDWQETIAKQINEQSYYDVKTENMEDDFTNGSGALRFGGSARGWDFDLMGFYLWDQIPTIHVNPELRDFLSRMDQREDMGFPVPDPEDVETIAVALLTDPFRISYHRVYGPGADIGTTFGSVSVRAEGTAIWGRPTYRKDFSLVEKPVYNGALNLEYEFPLDITVSGTLMYSFMGEYEDDLITKQAYPLIFIGFMASYFQERMTIEGAFAYDFSRLDDNEWEEADIFGEGGQFSAIVDWDFTDRFALGVGANYFWGARGSLFGLVKENSRTFVEANYSF
jgi:Phosphate-selective porin O and P